MQPALADPVCHVMDEKLAGEAEELSVAAKDLSPVLTKSWQTLLPIQAEINTKTVGPKAALGTPLP